MNGNSTKKGLNSLLQHNPLSQQPTCSSYLCNVSWQPAILYKPEAQNHSPVPLTHFTNLFHYSAPHTHTHTCTDAKGITIFFVLWKDISPDCTLALCKQWESTHLYCFVLSFSFSPVSLKAANPLSQKLSYGPKRLSCLWNQPHPHTVRIIN